MGASGRPPLLLVEDEERVVMSYQRLLQDQVDLRITMTVREALEVLSSPDPLRGAIVDIRLPDGNGMDAVERVRPSRPRMPVLFLTALCEPALVNRAFAMGAKYLCKPVSSRAILDFVRETAVAEILPKGALRSAVERLAQTNALTPRESEVVSRAATEMSRKEIADSLGMSLGTLDTHIGNILRKTHQPSLQELGRSLRRPGGWC